MRIKGWRSTGLRCPDHSVSFLREGDQCHPVSLIQMPNGTGKTTTLELLRAALSGSLEESGPNHTEVVRAFRCLDPTGPTGDFSLDMLLDGRLFTIQMLFNFRAGTVRYETILPSGHTKGFNPPQQLRRFLRAGFVNFFVFDGELAQHLLEPEHTNAQDAIEDLFQLSIFERLKNAVGEYWLKNVGNDTATEIRGLSRRANRVALLEDRLKYLQSAQRRTKAKRDKLKAQYDAMDAAFNDKILKQRRYTEKLTAAQKSTTEAEADVQTKATELLELLRSPHAVTSSFGATLLSFKSNLDRVRLPESAAREFFEELSHEQECVCGRPITPVEESCIRERAAMYLGSDEVGRINAIKTDIELYITPPDSSPTNPTQRLMADLRIAMRNRTLRSNERDHIQREAIGDDPELKKAKEELQKLHGQIQRLNDELAQFDDNDDRLGDDKTMGIRVISRRLKDASEKLDFIRRTIDLKTRRDILTRILDESFDRARSQLNHAVMQQTNERITALMPSNALAVSAIDKSLRLKDKEGGSVGETLCVAYSFLSTLFTMTQHDLPFIVDSPANPIDMAVRREVAALLPKLSRQFVAFTISTERAGFLDRLEAAAGSPVHYLTLYRNTHTATGVLPCDSAKMTTTRDGVLICDREYFRTFHVDGED